MDLSEAFETGAAFSLPLSAGSSAPSMVSEVRSVVSSAWGESPVFQLSSSEEGDVLSVEGGAGGGDNSRCVKVRH